MSDFQQFDLGRCHECGADAKVLPLVDGLCPKHWLEIGVPKAVRSWFPEAHHFTDKHGTTHLDLTGGK